MPDHEPAASDLVILVDSFETHDITWDQAAGRGRCSCGDWAAFDVSFFEFRGAASRHLASEREKAARRAAGGSRPRRAGHGASGRGAELVARYGSVRAARRATHPDSGGSAEDFIAVQTYATRFGEAG